MKNIFKKNQMIITALAIMIAVAGYLNYSGSKLDSAKVETDADASTGDDAEAAADISAEDIYAQTGLEELQFADGDVHGGSALRSPLHSHIGCISIALHAKPKPAAILRAKQGNETNTR